jgi:hypothetical protein
MTRYRWLIVLCLGLAFVPRVSGADPRDGWLHTNQTEADPVGDMGTDLSMAWFTIEAGGGAYWSDEFMLEATMGHSAVDYLPDDPDPAAASSLQDSALPVVSSNNGIDVIREFALLPISPNPSPGMAYIAWSVPRESRLRLTVHDVQGRQVAVLADGVYTVGRHVMRWNTLGESRRPSPGLYFVRLQSPDGVLVRRLVLAL